MIADPTATIGLRGARSRVEGDRPMIRGILNLCLGDLIAPRGQTLFSSGDNDEAHA